MRHPHDIASKEIKSNLWLKFAVFLTLLTASFLAAAQIPFVYKVELATLSLELLSLIVITLMINGLIIYLLKKYKQPNYIIQLLGLYKNSDTQNNIAEGHRINDARLSFVLQHANNGFWDWNLATEEMYFSPRWKAMLGYQDDELSNQKETWLNLMDAASRTSFFKLAVAYANDECSTFEAEYRMQHKNGHWLDLLARAKHATDSDGQLVQPKRLIGVQINLSDLKQRESKLIEAAHYQHAFLNSLPFMVWFKDFNNRFLSVNTQYAQNFGEDNPENLIGKTDFDYSPKALAEQYWRDDLAILQTKQTKSIDETFVDAHGNSHWIETFKGPITDRHGNLIGTAGFARDISERKRIEAELKIAAIAFESQEGIIITDAHARILRVNYSFTKITGFTAKDAIGQKMSLLKSSVHDADFYREMWQSIVTQGAWQGEVWNKRKCGEVYPEWLTISAIKDSDGLVTHYVGTMIDITTRKSIEARIHHLAHYDLLTDLPNRTLLTDRLHQALAQAHRDQSMLALMFLDLDKFKIVNDSLGHNIGDLLLKAVAKRLNNCVKRQTDTVSRIGGDEFIILLAKIESEQDAATVADALILALTEIFYIEGHAINVSCSIGISVHPTHGSDVESLLRVADAAMYEAKRAGRGCFRFYREDAQ